EVPAEQFRGSMTLPRRLGVRRRDGELRLVQDAVAGASAESSYTVTGVPVDGRLPLPGDHRSVRVTAEFEAGTATRVGLEVRVGSGERTVVAVDLLEGTVSLDRSGSGAVDVHPDFTA